MYGTQGRDKILAEIFSTADVGYGVLHKLKDKYKIDFSQTFAYPTI